jgi:hypothetical protein
MHAVGSDDHWTVPDPRVERDHWEPRADSVGSDDHWTVPVARGERDH